MLRFFYFRVLGLKLPIHASTDLGISVPSTTSPIILNQKGHLIVRKHIVWVIESKNRPSGSTWTQDREKGKDKTGDDSLKSHKSVIFHLFGEKPQYTDYHKVLTLALPKLIIRAKFKHQTFVGCDFTGAEFPNVLMSFAWPYSSAALMRCLWETFFWKFENSYRLVMKNVLLYYLHLKRRILMSKWSCKIATEIDFFKISILTAVILKSKMTDINVTAQIETSLFIFSIWYVPKRYGFTNLQITNENI